MAQVIRWAGWAAIMAQRGKKAKRPEYWYPLIGDKNQFDKKYETDMRTLLGDIRKKYKRKGVTSG